MPFLVKYCAWCYPDPADPEIVLLEVMPAERYGVTHGICPQHYQELITQIGEEKDEGRIG